MTTTISAVIARAASQIGAYYPGNSPYGEWYASRNGSVYRNAQFCAMGLSWCFSLEGGLDIFPEHAYTPSGVTWFKKQGRWHSGSVNSIRRGDIIYFDFPGAPNRVSHVAIAEKDGDNGRVQTIEFNTSGTAFGDQRNGRTVARKVRSSSIVGWGRPAYADNNATPPAADSGRNVDGSLRLVVDGIRGPATVARWQEVMGTPIDGVISVPRSTLILADQSFLNTVVAREHIANLDPNQRRRHDTIDLHGYEDEHTIKVRQFWLRNTVHPTHQERLNGGLLDFDGVLGPKTNRVHQYALNYATGYSKFYGNVPL